MLKTLNVNRSLIIFGIPLSLFVMLMFLMKSSLFTSQNYLDLGVTIDLVLIIPFVYFLLIRKSKIPKTTVIPIMIIGLLLGLFFLPEENQIYLKLFKTWILPLVELSVITFIIVRVRGVVKKYKTIKGLRIDFFSAVKNACHEILPDKLVTPFATEVAVFYYGFLNWKKIDKNENEFTYHKESGSLGLLGGILLIILIETVALHFLLANWSELLGWILTLLSIYTLFQVFGIAKSLTKRPIVITDSSVFLKYGIANEVDLLFEDIESIELSEKEVEKAPLTKRLSLLGELEPHNVVIKVTVENELIGIYGFKKKFKTLLLHVDEPIAFKAKIDNVILKDKTKEVRD
jgi:hypothetical protein